MNIYKSLGYDYSYSKASIILFGITIWSWLSYVHSAVHAFLKLNDVNCC